MFIIAMGEGQETRKIVYVSSCVTNASEECREFVRTFKEKLRSQSNTHILEWIDGDSPIAFDGFFKKDLNNVKHCDFMIAIIDEPSIGIGMELGEAFISGKPLLCLHKKGALISRLLLSAQDVFDFTIQEYETLDDAVAIAAEFTFASPELAPLAGA